MKTRLAPSSALFVLLALCALGGVVSDAVAGGFYCDSVVMTVQEDRDVPGRSTVWFSWSTAVNPPLVKRFVLAVPNENLIEVNVLSLTTRTIDPSDVVPDEVRTVPYEIGPALRFRDQWTRGVTVHPLLDTGGGTVEAVRVLILEVLHDVTAGSGPAPLAGLEFETDRTAELLAPVVINPEATRRMRAHLPDLREKRAGEIDDLFAHSERWVRLDIGETGLHRVTYDDLRNAIGSEIEQVDPATLRLFSSPLVFQPEDPVDARGSWQLDPTWRENPLRVDASGSTLVAGDAFWFYGVGPSTWTDRFDPTASMRAHFEHPMSRRLSYWLTWDTLGQTPGDFASAPLRMGTLDATVSGTADRVREDARARAHFEERSQIALGTVEDGWIWSRFQEPQESRNYPFTLEEAVPDSATWLLTEPYMERGGRASLSTLSMVYSVNGSEVGTASWSYTQQIQDATAPYQYLVDVGPLAVAGTNVLTTRNTTPSTDDVRGLGVMDYFNFNYVRRLRPVDGRLEWMFTPIELSADETWVFRVRDAATSLTQAFAVDVTDPAQPVWLQGEVAESGARYDVEVLLEGRSKRRFEMATPAGARRPVGLTRTRPRLLRAEVATGDGSPSAGWDMVILHPAQLERAAEDLAVHRRTNLAGHPSPRVTAVDLQDVYDQFGHGAKDPGAIRNYLKFLFLVDPRLEFVVLMGDANRDPLGIFSAENAALDLCPTYVRNFWPNPPVSGNYRAVPYAHDDWLASFDAPVSTLSGRIDLPDLSVGRIPAANLAEADRIVSRIIDYENDPATGPWRNSIMLVADDEVRLAPPPSYREDDHVTEAECLAESILPSALDVEKLFLTDYQSLPGVNSKPSARQAMRSSWSDGHLIVHYIGHGSPEQMADENVFRIEDVPGLTNGARLPLFLAFSCDVSIFDDVAKRSMSEQMVLQPQGGAIATIAATQVTFIGPNEDLTEAFYPLLFPSDRVTRSAPLGRALWQAKLSVPSAEFDDHAQHNNAKYALLGDPAMQLVAPEELVGLSGSLVDVVRSGHREELTASITDPAKRLHADSGRWYLLATESADSVTYIMDLNNPSIVDSLETAGVLPYVLDGNTFYRGSGTFEDGSFTTELRTPAFMRSGRNGRVRVLMESGPEMFVAVAEPLEVSRSAPDTVDVEGPTIEMQFENDARRVQSGAMLDVRLEDPSGINVLGSTPSNSVLMEFDNSGVSVNVSELLVLDENSFTGGTVQVVLPADLEPGTHELTVSAGDMLNNVSRETVQFELVATGEVAVGDHAPLPNPFRDQTHFVVEVIAPPGGDPSFDLDIYSLDGSPVRRLRGQFTDGGGRTAVSWDGRDERGDEIANGTYIYTLRVHFPTQPPVTETVTGKVVRMR